MEVKAFSVIAPKPLTQPSYANTVFSLKTLMGVNKRYNSTSNNPNKNRIFIIVRKSLKLKVELPYFEKIINMKILL